jgi:hypothetical protein
MHAEGHFDKLSDRNIKKVVEPVAEPVEAAETTGVTVPKELPCP